MQLKLGGEVSCTIKPNLTNSGDYYVCITGQANSNYTIRYEQENEKCGFYDAYSGTYPIDYYIFAQSAKYAGMERITFDNSVFKPLNPVTLKAYLFNYVMNVYNGECEGGCAIPIKIIVGASQEVTISNVELSYTTTIGKETTYEVYDLTENPAKISSDFLQLYLDDANLSVDKDYGEETIELTLGGEEILSEEIDIVKVTEIKAITPRVTTAATPTTFTATVSSPGNKSIASYIWDFGDGDTEETTVNSVSHTYSETGSYMLELIVEDADGLVSRKSFSVIAGNPKQLVNDTIKKYRRSINNLTSAISAYPSWYSEKLKEAIELDSLDDELKSLEAEFDIASEEGDYVNIAMGLMEMKVPKYIREREWGNFPLLLDVDSVNFAYLETLGAGTYDEEQEDEYKNALLRWYESNIEANADFFTVSAYYDNEIMPLLTYFKLKILAAYNNETYLVIDEDAIINSPDATKVDSASAIKFPSLGNREVEFVILGEVEPLNAVVYISPKFSNFNIVATGICNNNKACEKERGENWKNCKDCSSFGIVLLYLGILIIAAFIVYLIMQKWYTSRYESHLFKNKNDLFNLVNFINNASSRGVNSGEITKKLKKAGWSGEQISYAFKKVKGKRTGMPVEIKISHLFKKKEDINKK